MNLFGEKPVHKSEYDSNKLGESGAVERAVKTMPKWLKVLLRIFVAVLAVIVLLVVSVLLIWHDEITTVLSVKMLRERFEMNFEGAVYTMNVSGDFYLDEFVEQGGVSDDQELVDFIVRNLTKGLFDLEITVPDLGCSSFTAKTDSGDFLFARNYDSSMTNGCIVFTEASAGRHATITSVDLKHLGIDPHKDMDTIRERLRCIAAAYAPLDGMNDAGVACAIHVSHQGGSETTPTDQQTEKPDITPTTLVRLILDYADNLEEAIAIAQAYDLHDSIGGTYHYMVADASGRSAILEWIGDFDAIDVDGTERQLKVIYSDSDSDIGEMEARFDNQVITNFILYEDYYLNPDSRNVGGFDRYQRIWEELEETQGILADEQRAMDILEIVGVRNWAHRNEGTAHSIVFNMTDRTVTWIPNENFRDSSAVYTFSFSDR